MKTILPPIHTSEETALVVADYPYSFRLRCKIRYWLETDPKKGARFCSQTTNPKVSVEVWNKPKKSTYSELGGAMFTDENGHVHWDGLSEYELDKAESFLAEYRAGLTAPAIARIESLIATKRIYEAEKARGEFGWQDAGIVASLVGRKIKESAGGGTVSLEKAQSIVREQVARRAALTEANSGQSWRESSIAALPANRA